MRRRDCVIFGVGLLVGGLVFEAAIGLADQSLVHNRYKKLNIFASVLSYIENDYVDPVDGRALVYGAIQGMVRRLDPYTVFIPPNLYKEMKAETSGEHGGPGLELTRKGKQVFVISPLPDSPAQRAGIKAGDEIVQIERKLLHKLSLFQIRRLLRGRPGSRLRLFIRRSGVQRARWFVIIREQIRVQSVYARHLGKGLYYAQIKSFQDRTERQLKAALRGFQQKASIRGLVLDLRNNPGGLFDQSVRVADLFLEQGPIVTAKGRTARRMEREMSHSKGTWKGFPIVILVNQGTASAAEIVSGALQDHRRALVLGTRSFGKGSVQTIIDLSDGSGLKMTIARYYTPLGRLIHGRGIQPDVINRSSSKSDLLRVAKRYLLNGGSYKKALGRGLGAKYRKKFVVKKKAKTTN
ncbi:MAG: S41 family peptidase [Deltaproteobacteria bacterium]|nr:MAG: S41 family peptidase [Deltaproteobacteria bacterium]